MKEGRKEMREEFKERNEKGRVRKRQNGRMKVGRVGWGRSRP